MKKNLLLQAAILLLSGCVSITLAQAGSGGGGGAGGHGGGQTGAGNATTGNAGGGGANTNATAPDSNLPSGVQGNASQKTEAGGTHAIGMPQSDVGGKGRTMTGCIAREGSDYFLVSKNGNRRIRLEPGTTDLSAHVGHEVKVTGTTERGNKATMGTTADTTNPDTTTGGRGKHERAITVDKLDMVSENCPASTGTGSSTTPPPPQL